MRSLFEHAPGKVTERDTVLTGKMLKREDDAVMLSSNAKLLDFIEECRAKASRHFHFEWHDTKPAPKEALLVKIGDQKVSTNSSNWEAVRALLQKNEKEARVEYLFCRVPEGYAGPPAPFAAQKKKKRCVVQ